MFLCSDSLSNPTAYCQIHTFAIWYTDSLTIWTSFKAGLTRNLLLIISSYFEKAIPIATYIFNELSGYSAADSTKKLGTAYFGILKNLCFHKHPLGSSSASNPVNSATTFPKWLSNEAGIEFTTPNQYVTIPRFSMPEFDDYYSGSLTISFWIKYSPGSAGFIFKYHDTINNFDHIYIYLQANGALDIQVQGQGDTSAPVDPFVWKAITVSINFYNGDDGYIFAYMESSSLLETQIAPGNFEFHPSDVVTIGGLPSFIGSISNFRIFSPGSFVISDASNFLYLTLS